MTCLLSFHLAGNIHVVKDGGVWGHVTGLSVAESELRRTSNRRFVADSQVSECQVDAGNHRVNIHAVCEGFFDTLISDVTDLGAVFHVAVRDLHLNVAPGSNPGSRAHFRNIDFDTSVLREESVLIRSQSKIVLGISHWSHGLRGLVHLSHLFLL